MSAILVHCCRVGSHPVGLWAHVCNSTTEFSGASDKSAIKPSKSNPLFAASQYLYFLMSSNPELLNTLTWLSAKRKQKNKNAWYNFFF